MATFVLVHGAWHGGWCWKRVAARLRQAGHEVFTPTLTGLGERAHLIGRHVDLETHIRDILGVLQWEELSDVVLCGHSYGGMVISGVADRVPNELRSLVYLDAFVPADGQCLLDFIPERLTQFRQNVRERGSGWLIPPPSAAIFKVNEADRDWVDRQTVPHPIACFEQRINLTGAVNTIAKRVYIRAADYPLTAYETIAEHLRNDVAWRVHTVPSGHDVMIDIPETLAKLLIEAA
jgi:pimeloyl-ACP methyl ester carboxylesterase